jgi:hypothetical protein
MSRDVRMSDPEMVQQRRGIGRMLRETHRPPPVAAVQLPLAVSDQLKTSGQRVLGHQRKEAVRDGTRADQQNRLA